MGQSDESTESASFNVNRTTILEFDPHILDPSQCCTLTEYPSDEVLDWLHNVGTTAMSTSNLTSSGQVKLVLINIDTELWDSAQQPLDLLENLTDVLEISHDVFNTADIVESSFYPARMDSYFQPSITDTPISRGSVAHIREGAAWNHFASSGCTVGVVWHAASRNEGTIAYLASHMVEYRSISFHPSFLPLMELQSLTVALAAWEKGLEGGILSAQVESGFHGYAADQPPGVLSDGIELGLLSARVSGLAANTSATELCLRGLLSLAAAIRKQNTELNLRDPSSGQMSSAQLFIDAQVVFTERKLEGLIQRATSWQHRATIVIQGLFNLIAQRDQMANFSLARESTRLAEQGQEIALKSAELAEETKRDSASMKAIAAVTMCFLPGTFVASFLAMPIFQLDSNSQALTTHQMWIYWTITAPLTLLTIATWYLWDRWANRQKFVNDFVVSTRSKDKTDRHIESQLSLGPT